MKVPNVVELLKHRNLFDHQKNHNTTTSSIMVWKGSLHTQHQPQAEDRRRLYRETLLQSGPKTSFGGEKQ